MDKIFSESTKRETHFLSDAFSVTHTPFYEQIFANDEEVLYIEHKERAVITNYRHEFNTKTGELVCSYKIGGISVKTKHFFALNENAFCILIKSSKPISLNCKANKNYKMHIKGDGFENLTSLEIVLAKEEVSKSCDVLLNTNTKRLKNVFKDLSFDVSKAEKVSSPVMKYNKSADLFSALFNLRTYIMTCAGEEFKKEYLVCKEKIRSLDINNIYQPDTDVFSLINAVKEQSVRDYCINRIIDEHMMSSLYLKDGPLATVCFADSVMDSILFFEDNCLNICTALPVALSKTDFSLEGISVNNGLTVWVKHTESKIAVKIKARSQQIIGIKISDSDVHDYSLSNTSNTLFVYEKDKKDYKRYTKEQYDSIFVKERI